MAAAQSDQYKQRVLLLGMAFHDKSISENPNRGQGYRDRVRCEAVEELGYEVRTLDDKHNVGISAEKKHCQANFADPRRMKSSMEAQWTNECKSFDFIILDYFFSPAGWARTRWTDKFYKETLPFLASEGYIKPNGLILLPNLKCVTDSLDAFSIEIDCFYSQSFLKQSDLSMNPLYLATENVEEDLLKCPDKLNNHNQIKPIIENSENIFICLKYNPDIVKMKSSQRAARVSGIKRRRLHDKDFPSVPQESDIIALESDSYRRGLTATGP